MFKDYYAILAIDENATQEDIKSAFKKQALKWHPDRNIGVDTTIRMQEINEAYVILKDTEARERYNIEYQKFKNYREQQQSQKEQSEKNNQSGRHKNEKEADGSERKKSYYYSEYKVDDDILKNWMTNAKRQAVDLAKQTIEDLKGMVKVGAKAAVKEAGNQFIYQIIISIIFLLIFGLAKSCNT